MSHAMKSIEKKWGLLKKDKLSLALYLFVAISAFITVGCLLTLIWYILSNGLPHITPSLFAVEYTSDNVSLFPAAVNTLLMVAITLMLAVPLGIFTAIYLVEYAKRGSRFVELIRLTTETLSGIPSIVYGLFGTIFFVTYLKMGYSLLAGCFTLSIMILPLVIRTTEEALQSVSDSYREASFGLGAGKLRTIFVVVLPAAIPGILAGVILSIGRIVGESAALIFTAGTFTGLALDPRGSGRTLATHMYMLSGEGLHINQAYATAVILLAVVMVINMLSGYVAKRLSKGKGE